MARLTTQTAPLQDPWLKAWVNVMPRATNPSRLGGLNDGVTKGLDRIESLIVSKRTENWVLMHQQAR